VSARALVGALALLLVGACRLEVDVNVEVAKDGSGRVEVVAALDAEAVERLGGDLDAALALDDLEQTGWEVRGPTAENDGFTRIRVSKPFGTAEEAADVFAEIAPADGPFQGFGVSRDTSFAMTEWGFGGRVDFSGGIEVFGDEALAAELDGEPIGRDVAALEEQLGAPLSQLIDVRIDVRLPGEVTSNATTSATDGATWQVPFGAEPLVMEATGSERRPEVLVWTGIGALLALALVLLVLVRLVRRMIRRRRHPPAHATAE
jgi:hypothetical protein